MKQALRKIVDYNIAPGSAERRAAGRVGLDAGPADVELLRPVARDCGPAGRPPAGAQAALGAADRAVPRQAGMEGGDGLERAVAAAATAPRAGGHVSWPGAGPEPAERSGQGASPASGGVAQGGHGRGALAQTMAERRGMGEFAAGADQVDNEGARALALAGAERCGWERLGGVDELEAAMTIWSEQLRAEGGAEGRTEGRVGLLVSLMATLRGYVLTLDHLGGNQAVVRRLPIDLDS